MSVFGRLTKDWANVITYGKAAGPRNPTPPPGPANPNDAANNAQAQTDAMRQQRGLLANIYAGQGSSAPVTGKSQLGT